MGAGQWDTGEPALSKKVLMGSFCQFLWYKYTVADFKLQAEQPAYNTLI